jgi:hypothetical protein
MSCVVERRDRCRRLRHDLEALAVVADVDVLAPHEGQHPSWTVDAVVVGRAIPAGVTQAVAAAGLNLLPAATGPRGEPPHVEVVCRV